MVYRKGFFCLIFLLYGLFGSGFGTADAVTARLLLSDTHPLAGDQVMVDLLVDMRDADARLGAYAAHLRWDASVVQLAAVQDGATAAFADPQRHLLAGELRLSQFSTAGSDSVVSLVRLVFDVVGKVGQTTGLHLRFDVLDAVDTFASLLSGLRVQTSTLVVSDLPPEVSPIVAGWVQLSSALPRAGGRLTAEILLHVLAADRLGAYSGRLSWDPAALQLVSISDGETAAFANGQIGTEPGAVLFSNLNVQGESGAVSLLKVTFDVVGVAGQTGVLALTFDALDAAGSFESFLPYLRVGNATFAIAPSGVSGVAKGSDFDGSGAVDFIDFLIFAQHYGARLGDAEFVAALDLSGNGAVDFSDFLIFAQAAGQFSD